MSGAASAVQLNCYVTVQPPSTTRACPVTKLDASDARKSSAPTSSLGAPIRRRHVRSRSRSRKGSSRPTAFSLSPSVFENGPGTIAFDRTPCGPQNDATYRVKANNAAFPAEYPGGFINSVPVYRLGLGATNPYMVAMLTILPRPCSFIAGPSRWTTTDAQYTPAVRLRIH